MEIDVRLVGLFSNPTHKLNWFLYGRSTPGQGQTTTATILSLIRKAFWMKICTKNVSGIVILIFALLLWTEFSFCYWCCVKLFPLICMPRCRPSLQWCRKLLLDRGAKKKRMLQSGEDHFVWSRETFFGPSFHLWITSSCSTSPHALILSKAVTAALGPLPSAGMTPGNKQMS